MQQPTLFSYSFSGNEKGKKQKLDRKPQPKKKLINYIDTRYIDSKLQQQRNEMDKDIVF